MKVKTADRITQVKEYYFSKKLREIAEMRANGADIINLGVGSPDQLPSDLVISRLQFAAGLKDHHGYQSYTGIPELKEALAGWYRRYFGVSLKAHSDILPLIGSKEGIMHISMTYLQPGDLALIPDPGYPTYAAAARLAGADILYYSLTAERNWFPDLEALEEMDLSSVKLMWINYPNMPTGASASPSQLAKLVDFCRRHEILLCHDNPYAFILNDRPQSIFEIKGAKELALELMSLSKSYNMAGWRIGFLAGHQDRIKEVLKFKSNMDSGMFKPMQLAGVEALSLDRSWFDKINAEYRRRRQLAEQLLEELQCTFDETQVGMFIWARIPADYQDGYSFSDKILNETGVFITPGNIFGKNGSKYVRISLCSNMKIISDALARCKQMALKMDG